jgi:hypothetical protein
VKLATPVVLALLFLSVGVPTSASWTAPPLALTAVDTTPTTHGTLVRLDGRFPAADLVARPYPLEVFVQTESDPGRVLSFSASRGARSGWIPFADELDLDELVRLSPWFLWPEPGGEIVHLGETRIEVLVPPDFPPGPTRIMLSVNYQGDPVLSNRVEVVLP